MANHTAPITPLPAVKALQSLSVILYDDMAMQFVSQSGMNMPILYGRIAASLGMLDTGSSVAEVREILEPIAENLKYLKARLAIQLEPSLFSNSTAAQRERALHVISAIDLMGEITGIPMQLTESTHAKGNHAQEAFRGR